jgi:hypothetical protein
MSRIVTVAGIFNVFLFMYAAEVEQSPLFPRPFIGLLYQPGMIYVDDCGAIGGMDDWQGKPKYSVKTCHNATLSTTNPT